jgi:hypothetical protein
MKKIILLSAICFLVSTSTFAQASELTLRMQNHNQFSFTLDGNNYPAAFEQHLENLRPGNHFLSVYTTQWRHHGWINKLVYRGSYFIEPATATFMSITNGYLQIDNIVDLRRPKNHCNHDFNYSEDNEYSQNHSIGVTNNYAPCAMSEHSFSNFIMSLENAAFENTKYSIANVVLRNNYFTTFQIKEILKHFSFENTKLEFAKSAYPKTIDQNNYYSVSDVFSFNSSTLALNNYLVSR